ncbi:hypothetical protein Q4491_06980 [Photobacterium sp. 2_MG-2023]|uniref:hypothetical protein n=1 Tax=Photobacterium sp. 2_MG-2023 TaxID=3062663 RepID=UPI0026E2495F|nr:hypothetical protein [Photobacterium sp. 2_MG-2023]MDO6581089.1 hypothetical protein [Photobacterium sp. 2_MG-2023]
MTKLCNLSIVNGLKLTSIASLLLLTGCASDSASVASPKTETNASATSLEPLKDIQAKIKAAEQTFAQNQALSWFATDSMDEARQALDEALDYFSEYGLDSDKANDSIGIFTSTTYLQATQEALTQFNQHIETANHTRAEATKILSEAFSNRTELNSISAAAYFPQAMAQAEKELKKLVDYIADNNNDKAINGQADLLRKQRALEVDTVTTIYLADSQKELKRLQAEQAGQHTPETLRHAETTLKATEAFITAEPRAKDAIQEKADATAFALAHARHIAHVVKQLKAMKTSDYERHILSYENILLAISQELGAEDLRNQPISEQGKTLVSAIRDTLNEQGDEARHLAEAKNKLAEQTQRGDELAVSLVAAKQQVAALQSQYAVEKNLLIQQIAQLTVNNLPAEKTTQSPPSPATAVQPIQPVKHAETSPQQPSDNSSTTSGELVSPAVQQDQPAA